MTTPYLVASVLAILAGLRVGRSSSVSLRLVLLLVLLVPYSSMSSTFFDVGSAQTWELLHPATWAIVIVGGRAVLRDLNAAGRFVVRYRFAVASAAVIVLAGVWWTLRSRGHLPGPILLDQVVVPFALFAWIRVRIDADPAEAMALPRFVVAVAGAEALLALTGTVLHFQSVWGIGTDFGRQAATLNGPLPLSLLLVSAIPLTVTVRSTAARVGLVLLLIGGVLTTQSRSGVVLSIIGAVFVIFAGRASVGSRVIVLLLAPVVVVAVLSTDIVSGVASRFQDDLGSAGLRSTAGDFFWEHWSTWLLQGQGVGSSYSVTEAAGLSSSFESAFYMYTVDLGLIVTVGAFLLMLVQLFAARPWNNGLRNGGAMAGLICFLLVQGFSSIATEAACGAILWTTLALGAGPSTRPLRPEAPSETAGEVTTALP